MYTTNDTLVCPHPLDVASSRASQLAAVALSIYDAGGRGVMQLPFTTQHKLVSALQGAANLPGTGMYTLWLTACRVVGHV